MAQFLVCFSEKLEYLQLICFANLELNVETLSVNFKVGTFCFRSRHCEAAQNEIFAVLHSYYKTLFLG